MRSGYGFTSRPSTAAGTVRRADRRHEDVQARASARTAVRADWRHGTPSRPGGACTVRRLAIAARRAAPRFAFRRNAIVPARSSLAIAMDELRASRARDHGRSLVVQLGTARGCARRCRSCLQAVVVDTGRIESSRCPDSRKAVDRSRPPADQRRGDVHVHPRARRRRGADAVIDYRILPGRHTIDVQVTGCVVGSVAAWTWSRAEPGLLRVSPLARVATFFEGRSTLETGTW